MNGITKRQKNTHQIATSILKSPAFIITLIVIITALLCIILKLIGLSWFIWIMPLLIMALGIALYLGYTYGSEWTGFGEYRPGVLKKSKIIGKGEVQRAKTLWDWMELLIISAVLAAGGIWFNAQQNQANLTLSGQQHAIDLQIAQDQLQDTKLSTYLDTMTNLILTNKLGSQAKADKEISAKAAIVARARTLTTLRGLESRRKGLLLQFLFEAGLINRNQPVIDLSLADFSAINLNGAHLDNIDLRGANLSGAWFLNTSLVNADFSDADLSSAHLVNAKLSCPKNSMKLLCTSLNNTRLSNADLSLADLSHTDLSYAVLEEANLGYAILNSANLDHTDAYHANLNYTNLSSARLHLTNLGSALLNYAVLKHTKLEYADLNHALMQRSNLLEADLNHADLNHADLSYAKLAHANLSFADISDANFDHTDLSYANLQHDTSPQLYFQLIKASSTIGIQR